MLICDFPKPQRGERYIVRIDPTNSKPQRGERCIKPTNIFHAINAYCRIRVGILHWLVNRTCRAGRKGQIILEILLILKILVQTKDAFPAYPSDSTKNLLS